MIRLYKIRKEFLAGRAAVADVSFHVDRGEFVLLSGPSGAGKTTLLKILFGQERPSDGKGVVNGRNLHRASIAGLAALRRELGLVMQDPRWIERIPIVENIALAAEVCGVSRRDARRRACSLLELVALEHMAKEPPSVLSTGERQRVSVARALVNDPVLLLADEPAGNVDRRTAVEILSLLKLVNEAGTTVLVASSDHRLPMLLRCRTMRIRGGRVSEEEGGRLSACQ